MPTSFRTLLGAVLVAWATTTTVAQPLPTDPALTIGQLDNGLTYIVRQHSNPPGRAAMWIHLHTGSLRAYPDNPMKLPMMMAEARCNWAV